MSEMEFNQTVDTVRKEVALVSDLHSLTGLRASDWRQRAVVDKSRRSAPIARVRRIGEGQKRYR
jgi:hypothetical protein